MCTYLSTTTPVEGAACLAAGPLGLATAVISFDHPREAPFEHALCIDLRAGSADPRARVEIELDAASARRLAESILATLDSAEVRDLTAAGRGRRS